MNTALRTASPVTRALNRARAEGRAALIGYLPVGYPDVPTSIAAMQAMVAAGADIVEVGVPYSDPLMDGPVIQHAVEQALAQGTRVADTFVAVSAIAELGAAAVVMTYWNLVERWGVAAFAERLALAGGSGLITPDLIPDEAQEWLGESARQDLDRIFLVAPSSTDERIAMTARQCSGFIYAASTMGVTGSRSSVQGSAAQLVARVRDVSDTPVCVGLGVSTGAQAAEIAGYADGVIVGSAVVRVLGQGGIAAVSELTAELAAGVRAGRS